MLPCRHLPCTIAKSDKPTADNVAGLLRDGAREYRFAAHRVDRDQGLHREESIDPARTGAERLKLLQGSLAKSGVASFQQGVDDMLLHGDRWMFHQGEVGCQPPGRDRFELAAKVIRQGYRIAAIC